MNSPTLTARATQMGMILGTAAYMSPEQAKGRGVDRRADIWAFGAVLYEMLSGQRPFKGDDISDTLAAVLRQDVDWSALPASTPGVVRQLIARCLERDPKRRLRDIGEARIALESPAAMTETERSSPTIAPAAAVPLQRGFGAIHVIAAALLVALLAVSWLWWRASASGAAGVMTRVAVTLPPDVTLNLAIHPVVAMSRDGSKMAIVASRKGAAQLYLRPMNEFEPRPIAGTDDASSPFFSPDGTWIGFFARGKLKKVPAAGGPVIALADASDDRGGVWADDDTIIYTPGPATPIYKVPAAGGTPTAASTIDEAKHERTHRWPTLLPDGKTVLVTVGSVEHPDDYDEATIVAIRLDTGERHVVINGGRTARYVSSGHLLFLRDKVLFAVPFDVRRVAVNGTPVPVIDGISGDVTTGSAHYGVSEGGTIAFVPGDPSGGDRRLVWVDKQGKSSAIDTSPGQYGDPHVAPDGRRAAVTISGGASLRDIYVIDTVRGTSSRLTFGAAENRSPVWSHDGQRLFYVVYDRARNVSTITTKAADGSGEARAITEVNGQAYAEDVTRDESTLLFSANPSTVRGQFEVFRVAVQGGSKPIRILATSLNDVQNSALSPDGKWLAYYSSETGRPNVYVQSFPSGGSRAQVSPAGGTEPHWAPDGRALYYQQADGMMMVPIDAGPAFSPGKPQMLFGGVSVTSTDSGQTYDVAPKGDRFLMLRSVREGGPAPEVRVIVNWFDELRRLGGGK
jgi:serine/threonine-protein kinase